MNPRNDDDDEGGHDAWEWRGRMEAMLKPLVGLGSEPPLVVRMDRLERIMRLGVWIATVVVTGIVGLLIDRIAARVAPEIRYVEAAPHRGPP